MKISSIELDLLNSAPLARNGKIRLLFEDGHLPNPNEEIVVHIEQVQLEQVSDILMFFFACQNLTILLLDIFYFSGHSKINPSYKSFHLNNTNRLKSGGFRSC